MAAYRSIGLYPLSGYRIGASGTAHLPQLAFGFGNVSGASIDHAFASIGA